MTVPEREKIVRRSLNAFLLIFLCLGSLLGGMILIFYQIQTKNYESSLFAEEMYSLNLQHQVARNHFSSIVSDLLFLAEEGELKAYLRDASSDNLGAMRSEYLSFSANKKIYDQVRFLDLHGLELARVNDNNGQPVIVPEEGLQSKKNRYYFSDSLQLERGEVFVSPLDLNIEHGKVEVPFKPMIRFGTPVYDQAGVKRGVVLLNYLAVNLLQSLQDVGSVARGQTMLLNSDGYWLQHPDPVKEWGFMLESRAGQSFAQQHPGMWQQMLERPSGVVRSAEGVYSYMTIFPLGDVDKFDTNAEKGGSPEYFWKIVSFLSAESLSSYSKGLMVNLFILGAGLFLLTATVSWFLAMAMTRRKLYQAQLFSMAHFDNLTGLPNRTLFFDRLDKSLQLAKRYDRICALLYVDLDGFKDVNDNLGHVAGDYLLVELGQRLKACCRDSDTVARLGGDEFAVLLTEVSDAEGARVLTEKILAALQEPFVLEQGEARVGASIGITLFPSHAASLEDLLKSADQAMYLSKSRGKNTYTFAE